MRIGPTKYLVGASFQWDSKSRTHLQLVSGNAAVAEAARKLPVACVELVPLLVSQKRHGPASGIVQARYPPPPHLMEHHNAAIHMPSVGLQFCWGFVIPAWRVHAPPPSGEGGGAYRGQGRGGERGDGS